MWNRLAVGAVCLLAVACGGSSGDVTSDPSAVAAPDVPGLVASSGPTTTSAITTTTSTTESTTTATPTTSTTTASTAPIPAPSVGRPCRPAPSELSGSDDSVEGVRGEALVEYLTGIDEIALQEEQEGVDIVYDHPNYGGVWGDGEGGWVVAVLACSVVDADQIARLAGGPGAVRLIEVEDTFEQVNRFRDLLISELDGSGVAWEVQIDSTLSGRHIRVLVDDPDALRDDFGAAIPPDVFSVEQGELPAVLDASSAIGDHPLIGSIVSVDPAWSPDLPTVAPGVPPIVIDGAETSLTEFGGACVTDECELSINALADIAAFDDGGWPTSILSASMVLIERDDEGRPVDRVVHVVTVDELDPDQAVDLLAFGTSELCTIEGLSDGLVAAAAVFDLTVDTSSPMSVWALDVVSGAIVAVEPEPDWFCVRFED